jgi:hypothetical protein
MQTASPALTLKALSHICGAQKSATPLITGAVSVEIPIAEVPLWRSECRLCQLSTSSTLPSPVLEGGASSPLAGVDTPAPCVASRQTERFSARPVGSRRFLTSSARQPQGFACRREAAEQQGHDQRQQRQASPYPHLNVIVSNVREVEVYRGSHAHSLRGGICACQPPFVKVFTCRSGQVGAVSRRAGVRGPVP